MEIQKNSKLGRLVKLAELTWQAQLQKIQLSFYTLLHNNTNKQLVMLKESKKEGNREKREREG